MNVSHFPQVPFELIPEPVGQQRASVLAALAIAHDQLPPSEVKVLNPQPQSFHQSQPTPIQQPRHRVRARTNPSSSRWLRKAFTSALPISLG